MMRCVSRTRAVLTALSLLPALLLVGCSDDDPEPKFGPSPSPSSVVSSSPSTSAASAPVAPTMPAAARGSDATSAEAFVKFYWETVDYAQASGDVEPLRQLASRTCAPCRAGVEYLEGVFEAGGRVIGGVATLKVQKSTLVQGDDELDAVVKFTLTTTPQRVDYEGTEKDEHYPGGQRVINALLRPSDGGWVMRNWGIQT